MKRINKLKLTQLSKAELEAKQMNTLKGGSVCKCSCYYADMGGASLNDNSGANSGIGYTYSCPCSCYYEETDGSTWSANTVANHTRGISSPVGCNQYLLMPGMFYPSYCPTCDENNQTGLYYPM